ncbi:AMP-binding protein [Actinokineospora spheciospongiae]|uniref:AMP-binding protein n=1 Tax=Actinokineospora spheciospongiae TaxID=909613 RepID=UPI000D9ED581|nr:AMP-binding protein [Actinokineospora spheciospongiae]PWW55540.1 bile acid-coenzyme A ligase [Actinokineospora spheciospongiae]
MTGESGPENADWSSGTPLGVELDRLAADDPDAPAITCSGVTLSRSQLSASSNRYARALIGLGVRVGDRVTIGLPNGIEFYIVVVAAWKVGATPQPVSARLPSAELAEVIAVADPAVVVGLPAPDGRPSLPAGFLPDQALSDGPLPQVIPPHWKAPTSGGSTGRPKVILSAGTGTAGALLSRAGFLRVERGCTMLITAPLHHNAPFTFSCIALVNAGHVVVMPKFDAADVLAHIGLHRPTWVYMVPTLMGRVLALPPAVRAAANLSSVRTLFHIGAPCPEHVKRGWLEWVAPEVVLEHYSGTEAIAVTAIDGADWLRHPGSVGRVVSGEMLIADEELRPTPVGEVGEVWMRPPATGPTYQYLGAVARKRDAWESLGDMGKFDAEGYLYLADRRSDMILVGGANVYPAEVEAALQEHPFVESAVVIGLPDEDLGNSVHAIVHTSESVTDEELDAHIRARIAPYKVPRAFERSDTVLRDDAGKVRRSALRAARLPR